MLPKLKVSEVIVIDGDGESASGAVREYRIADLNQLGTAEQLAVGKISDLERAFVNVLSAVLKVWTAMSNEGKRVKELSSKHATVSKFTAQKTQHCTLQFSESFRTKHPTLVSVSIGTEGNWIKQIDPGGAKRQTCCL